MANPLAKRTIGGGGDGQIQRDEGPYRPDYPYTVEGHVGWLNDRAIWRKSPSRWRIVGSGPSRTFEPVVASGSDGWQREQAAKRNNHAAPVRARLDWMNE